MPEIPSVRDVPARDLQPGMRLEWGGTWQPPVSRLTTWGPGKDETPSHPVAWWTRVTVRAANGRLQERVFQPDFPVHVVSEVACRQCRNLVPVADAVVGRRIDRTVRPPRFVELYDLCPDCASTENGA